MNKSLGEFLVGLTVLLGLVGVAVLLLMFGELAGAGARTYPVFLRIPDATGLTTASRLTLNGVPIGTLRALNSDSDPRSGVIIELAVEQRKHIPRDVTVFLERGLVGEATLALRTAPLDAGSQDPGALAPGETLTTSAIGTFEQIAALFESKLGSFSDALADIRKLASSFAAAGDRLNEALDPRSAADVDAGKAPNFMSTVSRLDEALRSAKGWLDDDSIKTDVRSAAAKFNTLLDQSATAVESWNKAASAFTDRASSLGDQGEAALREFASAASALTETSHQVQSITSKIDRGEGTAGMLVNNPDLYRSLNDAAVRLERALTEAQLLAEKYRKEGIPLKF